MKKGYFFFIFIILCTSCFKNEASVDSENFLDSTKLIIDSARNVADSATFITDLSNTLIDDELVPSDITFDEARNLNTSEAWRRFLNENPDYPNKEDIEEKIIRAEVNEILNNEKTGKMPTFEKVRGGNQALSTLTIENNTSCDLTIRYSGKEAKKMVISPNSTSKVQLKSGKYEVVASACGYNYAGSELLEGNYNAVYFFRGVAY